MTKVLFAEWLQELDQMGARKQKILLLLDNYSAHRIGVPLKNVELLFFPPDRASELLPLNMGVITNFKICSRRRVIEQLFWNIDRSHVEGAPNPLTLRILVAISVKRMYGL